MASGVRSAEDWGIAEEVRELAEARARREAEEEVAGEAVIAPALRTAAFRDWALLVPEPKAGALSFADFPYQEALYSDEVAYAAEVVVQKSTQVGVSANMWRWAAWRADLFADTVLYWFPTDTHVAQFGDERIEPAIEGSEYLAGRVPGGHVRNKHQKRIGSGWMYLRGSSSSRKNRRAAGAQSVAGDSTVFDEYDDLEPRNVAQAERRLSGALAAGRTPRIRRVGVPSVPGYGIAAAFARSDQRKWHVACPACGLLQELDWWKNVRWTLPDGREARPGDDPYEDAADVDDVWRCCARCEASLEGDPIRGGRWIATNPRGRFIGFHLTRLIVPRTDLAELVKNSRKTAAYDVEAFHQNDLGLAYSAKDASLDEGDVLAACAEGGEALEEYAGPWPVTAGLDVAGARQMHIRVSEQLPDGRRRAIYIETVDDFHEVARLMKRFRIRVLAVDHMPERREARALAVNFPGRVVLVRYDDRPDSDSITVDKERNLVTINRTDGIDAMMSAIRSARTVPLRTPPVNYVRHLTSLHRRLVEDARGRPRRVYVTTGSAGDDYAHAEVYDLVATQVLQMKGVMDQLLQAQAQPQSAGTLGYDPVRLDAGFEEYGPAGLDEYDAGFGE